MGYQSVSVYQRRRRYHSGRRKLPIADREGLTLCYEAGAIMNDGTIFGCVPGTRCDRHPVCQCRHDPLATDVLEAAVRKLLDKYTDACMETIVMC
ncbi:MAG: hypothetical protein ACLVJ6_14365 [Merdibacter sp.]